MHRFSPRKFQKAKLEKPLIIFEMSHPFFNMKGKEDTLYYNIH